MTKKVSIVMAVLFFFGICGCATTTKNPQRDIPSQKASNGLISQIAKIFSISDVEKNTLVVVGFKIFEDKRPKQDVSYLTSIKEKVSEKILNNINEIQLFDEIHYPTLESDNIVISGEIRKFGWESVDTMISYIPGLNILPFLGLPSNRVHSEVEVYVEFKNKEANAVILGFVESYKKDKNFNIYNFQTSKAEEELASCFKIVLERIKEKIVVNKDIILDMVKLKVSQPVTVEQPLSTRESVPKEKIQESPSTNITAPPAPDINTTQAQAVQPQ